MFFEVRNIIVWSDFMQYNNLDFFKIISDIYENYEFKKLDKCKHHGITRMEHSLRVSYYTYIITKKLHLNYKEATRAALLHDFFTDEVSNLNMYGRFSKHPNIALSNAKKYFKINKFQEDIIVKHMWPSTLTPPKYIESWLVNIIDDISAVFERGYVTKNKLKLATSFIYLFIISRF